MINTTVICQGIVIGSEEGLVADSDSRLLLQCVIGI